MREPKLDDLMVDETATARLRASLAREKAVKITVTIDTSLHALRDASQRTGVPYQALVEPGTEEGVHEADHHGIATGSFRARSEADETNPGCLTSRQVGSSA